MSLPPATIRRTRQLVQRSCPELELVSDEGAWVWLEQGWGPAGPWSMRLEPDPPRAVVRDGEGRIRTYVPLRWELGDTVVELRQMVLDELEVGRR